MSTTERITLRAKSDGTEISGLLAHADLTSWSVQLAPGTSYNTFYKEDWERVYGIPTKPGTVFRATVRGVENVRVMVRRGSSGINYSMCSLMDGSLAVYDLDIDASTIVIELEGEEQ